jgi:histone H3/H4
MAGEKRVAKRKGKGPARKAPDHLKSGIKELARSVGSDTTRMEAVELLKEQAVSCIVDLTNKAFALMENAERSTLKRKDLVGAVEVSGHKVYGLDHDAKFKKRTKGVSGSKYDLRIAHVAVERIIRDNVPKTVTYEGVRSKKRETKKVRVSDQFALMLHYVVEVKLASLIQVALSAHKLSAKKGAVEKVLSGKAVSFAITNHCHVYDETS